MIFAMFVRKYVQSRLFDMPAKIRLLKRRRYYRTMSGGWRDSSLTRFVSKRDFRKLTLAELQTIV